jgi:glyoxylase-like metal-dependent hydrolase (beta-lactamase superfamily II)
MLPVAPGVWLLHGLVPYLINCYLVEGPGGDILFDAGVRQNTRRFLGALARRGRVPAVVALTHCHPDHQGTAASICRTFQIPLACHELDSPAMEGSSPMLPRKWPVSLLGRLWVGPPYPVSRRLREGDTLGEFRVVHTPGHTPGHVVYFRDRDRLLIAGDVVRNRVSRFEPGGFKQPPSFFSVDPAENRRSLRTLIELRPSLMCFGHGFPSADLAALGRYAARLGV